MEHFICPVCSENLILQERTYRCKNNHCFDCAKSGYVNLLRSQVSSKKRHGDDKLMIRSRTAFLEKGYYQPLLEGILAECDRLDTKMVHLCDIGCGEGWYTDGIFKHLRDKGHIVQMEGIDISKDALAVLSARNHYIGAAVASISALPIERESAHMLVNLFAPFDEGEFHRVLKKGGYWVKAIPLERHLWGLKCAIYETPYENKVTIEEHEGFTLVSRQDICYNIHLEGEDIQNLFRMTPYYYKTGKEDQERLARRQALDTEIQFAVLCYQKK